MTYRALGVKYAVSWGGLEALQALHGGLHRYKGGIV